jgi:tetratricopeptide (TPR) repeat protein
VGSIPTPSASLPAHVLVPSAPSCNPVPAVPPHRGFVVLVVLMGVLLGAPARAGAQDTSCNRIILEGTIRSYDEYLGKNPDDPEALANRGVAHFKLGNHEAALRDFERVARLNPGEPPFVVRGLVYAALGQMQRAFAEYNAALRRDPKDAAALYARGLAHRRNGDAAEADADLAEAARIDSGIATDFARLCVR